MQLSAGAGWEPQRQTASKTKQAGDSYHKIRISLPVISSSIILRDGHSMACRGFPHLSLLLGKAAQSLSICKKSKVECESICNDQ